MILELGPDGKLRPTIKDPPKVWKTDKLAVFFRRAKLIGKPRVCALMTRADLILYHGTVTFDCACIHGQTGDTS